MVETRYTTTESNYVFCRLISILHTAEEIIPKFKDISVETFKTEK